MEINILNVFGTAKHIYERALFTQNKVSEKEPSIKWLEKIIQAEHSVIRGNFVEFEFIGIPYFVAMQLARHKHGIEHFIQSQRTDKTGVDRHTLPQDTLINYRAIASFQAILNISKVRLCEKASKETRKIWQEFITELKFYCVWDELKALSKFCLPACKFYGKCREIKPCTEQQ